jgi:hypothetical protein
MTDGWLRKPEGDTSIVFVHGILSSAEKCWRHNSGTYWPDLLAREKEFDNLGIYTFSYRSDIFSGSYRLGDVVDDADEPVDDCFTHGPISLLEKPLDSTSDAREIGGRAALLDKDVFFTGPEGSGKTTAVNTFLSKSADLGKKTVLVNFYEYGEELRGGPDLWLGIGESIYDKFKGNPRLEAPGEITGTRQLTRYLFEKVLRIIYPLVIAFDEVGRLRYKPVGIPFYTMIRVWRERDNNLYTAQTRLRIALCGLERLREFPVDDEDDKSSRSIRVEDIVVLRRG